MSKGTAIAIGFEFFDGEGDASYEDEYEFYTVCLTKNTANARDIGLLLRKLFDEHASARADKGLDSPSCVDINLPFLCDPSFDPPRYMKTAHAIAHAVNQTRGNIPFERMSLLFEDVGIEDLWAWLPTLPGSIESLEIGMCAPGKRVVPSAVWESLPRLQKIEVRTSRGDDKMIGEAVEITRPSG
jgi:hypothetical protein